MENWEQAEKKLKELKEKRKTVNSEDKEGLEYAIKLYEYALHKEE